MDGCLAFFAGAGGIMIIRVSILAIFIGIFSAIGYLAFWGVIGLFAGYVVNAFAKGYIEG